MASIIGGEYLIGWGLIKQSTCNSDRISFSELVELCQKLQERFNSTNVDAVISAHSFPDTIATFDKYFEMVELDHNPYAICKAGVSSQILENRFIAYLPQDVLQAVYDTLFG